MTKKILLGSGSPRRRQLLQMMDLPFEPVKIKDVEENYPDTMPAREVPAYLSRLKADAYRDDLKDDELLITADTVVILDNEILGKPVDEADACRMLRRLSGREHHVVSGVTLTSRDKQETFIETTSVHFLPIPDDEIERYVERYRPLDKAGAYGIQEWIGLVGIRAIEGCFYNVMGLPTASLMLHLKEF